MVNGHSFALNKAQTKMLRSISILWFDTHRFEKWIKRKLAWSLWTNLWRLGPGFSLQS